ncbi:MAG: alpha/beta hydrolase [Spirochaetales bacterium]|nr:alpha/beta hydrolase [Leptospiraceae bacterium]MCP5481789.1 alpha/beta hydrolase [Spirochaetales bacterium]MCP5486905.1 alpha/beta hydrolase [Spirochaetales bacterium]
MPNESTDPAAREHPEESFWQSFASGLKKAAGATGRGLKYIYHKGDENKHYVVPAINGIVGDKLAEMNDARAIQMSFRAGGKDIDAKASAATIAVPGTAIVFVHGLMADEVLWQTALPEGQGFGPLLAKEPGLHTFYVRYNTGRHISQNGQDLSRLLDELIKAGGRRIERLVIVAHSMGGLVTRSAGYYGSKQKKKWVKKLSRVVLIGVPNDGSFLEKFGHLATVILKQIWNYPTRLVGRIADERSNGIKDLRWGFMVDEDWQQEGANDLLNVERTPVPPLPGVRYNLILGSLTESMASPLAMYFGDGLVGTRSATGQAFATPDDPAHAFIECRAFPTTGHIGLLASPEVFEYVREVVA